MPGPGSPPDARAAIWALAGELERRYGLTRLYGRANRSIGVLSISVGVTVWCDGRRLTWQVLGQQVTWPADDPDGAAPRLALLARRRARPPAPREL